jgi:hypothetical protein
MHNFKSISEKIIRAMATHYLIYNEKKELSFNWIKEILTPEEWSIFMEGFKEEGIIKIIDNFNKKVNG